MDPALAAQRLLEELSLNTSPAVHEAHYDGWVLRASHTDTRRANSVTALAPSTLPAADKIAFCEDWYRTYGQAPVFRMTGLFMPAEIDAMLAARGYRLEGETHVMSAALNEIGQSGAPLPAGVKRVERSEADGLADAHRMKGSDESLWQRDVQRQGLWKGRQIYLSLKTINGVVCTGLARVEAGHVGIFNMRTADHARGKGLATVLVSHLLEWGRGQGAHHAFLQVDCANAPALAVYRKFGFESSYRYWYRVHSTS